MISATMKMMSPLLNSMPDSVLRSPCSRITSTPISETTTPAACASVSRTPSSSSDHTATTSGPADCSSSVFSAWVYSSAQYCSVLNAPIPVMEIITITPSLPRIARQMFPGERQQDQERQRPAQERQRDRRNVTGGEPPDDGVAGPAQRGDGEQEIRLVRDPAAGRGRT